MRNFQTRQILLVCSFDRNRNRHVIARLAIVRPKNGRLLECTTSIVSDPISFFFHKNFNMQINARSPLGSATNSQNYIIRPPQFFFLHVMPNSAQSYVCWYGGLWHRKISPNRFNRAHDCFAIRRCIANDCHEEWNTTKKNQPKCFRVTKMTGNSRTRNPNGTMYQREEIPSPVCRWP